VRGLLLAAALSILGVYASDYAWLEYRIGHDTAGQAFGRVTFYYATALKNGRTEIFYDQPQTEVCVQALFPHAGYRPCWYAKKSQVRMVIKGGSGRQVGSIGMRAIPSHAMGAPAFSAACASGSDRSQSAAMKRFAVTPAAASDTSQSSGGTMISGWSILLRSPE